MICKIKNLTYKPYMHGWNHLKKAFGFTRKPQDQKAQKAVEKCLCSCKIEGKKLTLCGRIKHVGFTALLWWPILNIFVHAMEKDLRVIPNKKIKECNKNIELIRPLLKKYQDDIANEKKEVSSQIEFKEAVNNLVDLSNKYVSAITMTKAEAPLKDLLNFLIELSQLPEKKENAEIASLNNELKKAIERLERHAKYPILQHETVKSLLLEKY